MKKLPVAILLLLVACAIGACGAASDQKTTEKRYADDGYMGFSTANTGMLTSPHARTYGNDTEVVNRALAGMNPIRRTMVMYRGDTMIVRIRVDRSLSAGEAEAVGAEAERRLAYNLPRYHVRVKIYQ